MIQSPDFSSLTLQVVANRDFRAQDLINALKPHGIRASRERWRSAEAPTQEFDLLHEPGSAAGVAIEFGGDRVNVTLRFPTSKADRLLALRVLAWMRTADTHRARSGANGQIRDTIDNVLLPAQERHAAVLLEQAGAGTTTVLAGPVRPFHLGPMTASRLAARGGQASALARVVAAMQRVQHVPGNPFLARALRLPGRPEVGIGTWTDGIATVLPATTHVALVRVGDDDHATLTYVVPRAVARRIAGGHWEALDDGNVSLSPCEPGEWDQILRAGRAHDVAHELRDQGDAARVEVQA